MVTLNEERPSYTIHEVYYDKQGIPNGYVEMPSAPISDDVSGLQWNLNMMKQALDKPVLWTGDKFPQEYKE
jgi:hypothetical protein